MLDTNADRRTVLKTLGTGAAGVLATGRASATSTSASASTSTSTFRDDVDAVRQATERYRSVGTALEDGFKPGGPYVPGMGWHWVNPARIGRAVQNGLDLESPQILVYSDTNPGSPEGHLVLGAVEWAIPVGARGLTEDNQPDLFTDATDGPEEHWHVHHSRRHVFSTGDGGTDGTGELSVRQLLQRGRWAEVPPDEPVEPGDSVTADWGLTGETDTRTVDIAGDPHPDLLTLHAWVHLRNRSHVLAPFNPNQRYVHLLPDVIMSDRTAKPG